MINGRSYSLTLLNTYDFQNPPERIYGPGKWTHFGRHICTDQHQHNMRTPTPAYRSHGFGFQNPKWRMHNPTGVTITERWLWQFWSLPIEDHCIIYYGDKSPSLRSTFVGMVNTDLFPYYIIQSSLIYTLEIGPPQLFHRQRNTNNTRCMISGGPITHTKCKRYIHNVINQVRHIYLNEKTPWKYVHMDGIQKSTRVAW